MPKIKTATVPEEKREAVANLLQAYKELRAELDTKVTRIETTRKQSTERLQWTIRVAGEIHPETIFVFGTERHHFKDALLGPVQAKFTDGEIKFTQRM